MFKLAAAALSRICLPRNWSRLDWCCIRSPCSSNSSLSIISTGRRKLSWPDALGLSVPHLPAQELVQGGLALHLLTLQQQQCQVQLRSDGMIMLALMVLC